jgi:hypothetical protein
MKVRSVVCELGCMWNTLSRLAMPLFNQNRMSNPYDRERN